MTFTRQFRRAIVDRARMPAEAEQLTHDLKFPAGFLWGVSTAAHQVEGNNVASQWSAWEAAGRIRSGDRCGLACDWWCSAERDFDLAQSLGLNALRLSIEWSRIEPQPRNFDQTAICRYRQMLEALHQRGIRPVVSLHHFSHPLWFENEGGFLSPGATERFVEFAARVVTEVGHLCQDWVTFNEPNVYAALGYVLGEFPPGKKGAIIDALQVLGAMARAHAYIYERIHELQSHTNVGWAHNYLVFQPASSAIRDRLIARLASELFNETMIHAIEHGRLPHVLSLADGDLSEAKGTCDFVGLNVYSRFHVAFDPAFASQLFARVFVPPDVPQGDHGIENPYGEAYPPAISAAVNRASRLRKPIYILENGVPDAADRIRPWVIVSAVRELHRLIECGADVRGYFHWTLTDNFEWSEGWGLRFGLFHLDPKSQQRTPRPSARLYAAIARNNGLTPELVLEFLSDTNLVNR
jgi:beta-glucosidase